VGSIINRDGKWRAQVRRKGHKSQCKTFRTKAQAEAWVRQRESDIDSGEATPQFGDLTIHDVIVAYRHLRDGARPISDKSTEHYTLEKLDAGLGALKVASVSPDDLVAFATMRRDEDGAGPYTINMDVSKLGTVMRYGGAALKVPLPDIVGAARPTLTYLRLIGGGGKRKRLPTEDELPRLLDYLDAKRGRVYADAVAFAAITAMRRGEVCSFGHEDIDQRTHIVNLWRKHPRKGKELKATAILGEALDIVKRQPRGQPEPVETMTDRGMQTIVKTRVFPIEPGTLSKYFTEACRALSIPDLHLHDMRHEGTTQLFRRGYQIQEVAMFTGHADWKSLQIYANMKPEDVPKRPASRSRQGAAPQPDSPPSASPRRGKSAPDKSQR
jgi:integrase